MQKTFNTFSMGDNRIANKEGWGIFVNDNGFCEIRRTDGSPFETNSEAHAHVVMGAANGRELCQRALDHLSRFNNKQTEAAKISQGLPERLPDLSGFIGTENYYRYHLTFGRHELKYTDGVKHVADTASAYWLLDVVFSHTAGIYKSHRIPSEQKRLLVCELERVTKGRNSNGAIFTITDGNGTELARQEIEYTDFPAIKQSIWVQNGVAMLPTEY